MPDPTPAGGRVGTDEWLADPCTCGAQRREHMNGALDCRRTGCRRFTSGLTPADSADLDAEIEWDAPGLSVMATVQGGELTLLVQRSGWVDWERSKQLRSTRARQPVTDQAAYDALKDEHARLRRAYEEKVRDFASYVRRSYMDDGPVTDQVLVDREALTLGMTPYDVVDPRDRPAWYEARKHLRAARYAGETEATP